MKASAEATRASARIKARRHRSDQEQQHLAETAAKKVPSSSNKKDGAEEKSVKTKDSVKSSPVKKKTKETPAQPKKSAANAKQNPTEEESPRVQQPATQGVAARNPAAPTGKPSKKTSSALPCRKPPYPFYSPSEDPSFQKGIASVVQILRSSRNIAVLTGAGISVSCGIPDFRSQGVGLYSVLDYGELGLSCPEELFDWEFFQNNPHPFFQFAKKLYFPLENNQKVRPSDSHKLLRLLQDRKQLLRVYSQNIDGLEEEAGVLTKKVVYAHGSIKWATCLTCKRKVPAGDLEESILQGAVPYCQVVPPSKKSQANVTAVSTPPTKPIVRREPSSRQRKRPRTLGNEDEIGDNNQAPPSRQSSTASSCSSLNVCGGVLKPNVTFFGQVLPDNVSRCLESDRKKVDALIVIGTSLSVAPISKVIGYLPSNIPRILINRTIVHPRSSPSNSDGGGDRDDDSDEEKEEPDFRQDYVFDAYLLGNCDDVTRALVRELRADDTDPAGRAAPKSPDDLVEMGRLLSEVRTQENVGSGKGDDDDGGGDGEVLYRAEDWETAKVPAERVFLFPGAQPPTPSLEDSPVQLQEVCHCNACSKRIYKGHIHKCQQCFDYDLCGVCFPKVSPDHYEGQHTFGIEAVQAVR